MAKLLDSLQEGTQWIIYSGFERPCNRITEIKQRKLAGRRTVRQTATDCTLVCHVSGQTVKAVHFHAAVQRIIRRLCRYFPPTQDGSSDCSRTVTRDSGIQLAYYMVSIKSLTDYRYLLQEKYCTWNTIFLKYNSRSFFLQHISICAKY